MRSDSWGLPKLANAGKNRQTAHGPPSTWISLRVRERLYDIAASLHHVRTERRIARAGGPTARSSDTGIGTRPTSAGSMGPFSAGV